MVSSMVLVIDEAAGTEYHRFQTTFFNLKRASQREKSYTTAPHRNISVMHFFCSAQRWVHWRRENNNNFSLGPAVQDILIIHSIREKCLPLKLYSSTQPMLSPIPVTPPPFTAPQTHTHTLKMRVNPIKRDGLLHAWPPFPPSASTSSDQRGGFIIW